MTAWIYRRDYVRACRYCHRPITGAARNQTAHRSCWTLEAARRRKLRREIRRAKLGLFPGEKTRLEDHQLGRARPSARTRTRWYRWHTCATPGCGERFQAGHRARHCPLCAARRRREDARRRGALYILRHHPERAASIGSRRALRSLAPPAA